MNAPAKTAKFKQKPQWLEWLLSPATLALLVTVLACAWLLAQHSAPDSAATVSWLTQSTQSSFIRAWGLNAAILMLPAGAGFAIGWIAHRRSSSAVGSAWVAVAVVFIALWQFAEKRDDIVYTKPVPPAARAAASAAEPVRALAPAEVKPEAAAPKPVKDGEAELTQREKAREEPAPQTALSDKAPKPQRPAEPAPARPPVPMLADRNQMFVPLESSTPTSTAGAMPPPPPMQGETGQTHPNFPGCRWATPTTWVCDQKKP